MKFFEGIISQSDFDKLDDKDCAVVMVNTTDMSHVDNVTVKHCNLCGRAVWFADSTTTKIPQNLTVYLACIKCYGPKRLSQVQMQMPSDEQLREIATELHTSFEEIKDRITAFVQKHNKSATFGQN